MNEISGRYILMADDDSDYQMIFNEVFTEVCQDLNLHMVSSGNEVIECLRACQGHLPCLVVLDYNMPRMSGAEIIKELNKHSGFAAIPKVIFSTFEDIRTECLNAGAIDCFNKPSSMAEYINIMKTILQYAI